MRMFYKSGMALALGVMLAGSSASAQQGPYGAPSLLPLPDAGPQTSYPTANYSGRATLVSGQPTPANPGPALAPEPIVGEPVDPGPTSSPVPTDNNNSLYDDAASCGWGDDCASGLAGCGCQGPWFASFTGLVMSRNNPNPFWTSYETNNNANQVLNTRDAHAGWNGGGEIRLGRWFGCGCANQCGDNCGDSACCGPSGRQGIEVSYFTLGQLNGFASIRGDSLPGGSVSTPIDLNDQFGPVTIGGNPASDYFDGATEHRIWRNDEIHNIEINFLSQQLYNSGRAQFTWLAGVRYFKFDDSLIFGSVAGGFEFGQDPSEQAYISSRAVNNMVGFQIGGRSDFYVTQKLSVFGTPKIGIYGNSINVRNRFYLGDGTEGFDITARSTDVSFLASIDLGVAYQFSSHWRAFVGYRALAVTQVALADNQYLPYLAATNDFGDAKTNGSLILHGGMAGLEFCW